MPDMKKSKKSVPPNIKNEASDHLKKTVVLIFQGQTDPCFQNKNSGCRLTKGVVVSGNVENNQLHIY